MNLQEAQWIVDNPDILVSPAEMRRVMGELIGYIQSENLHTQPEPGSWDYWTNSPASKKKISRRMYDMTTAILP